MSEVIEAKDEVIGVTRAEWQEVVNDRSILEQMLVDSHAEIEDLMEENERLKKYKHNARKNARNLQHCIQYQKYRIDQLSENVQALVEENRRLRATTKEQIREYVRQASSEIDRQGDFFLALRGAILGSGVALAAAIIYRKLFG